MGFAFVRTISLARCAALLMLAGVCAQAQLVTTFKFEEVNLPIPDNSFSGVSDTRTISGFSSEILKLSVSFTLSGAGDGAFNGDFYAYISLGDNLAVLLNRPGRTSTDSVGYGDSGFLNVRFDDEAANGDIHVYRETLFGDPTMPLGEVPTALTGAWAPDGRATFPTLTLESDARLATLSVFNGLDPNGEWTLFIADVESGGTALLSDWSLEIVTVPEPAETMALFCALSLLFGVLRSRFFRVHRSTRESVPPACHE